MTTSRMLQCIPATGSKRGHEDVQEAAKGGHLIDLLHGIDGLVHELSVVLLWPVPSPLHVEGRVLRAKTNHR